MTPKLKTVLVVLAGTALCACPAAVVTNGAATGVVVVVTPGDVEVEPGGTVSFRASVTGTANTSVTWSVSEGAAGGTITADGLYTAPSVKGTYHVVATSVADKTKNHTVQVKVGQVAVTISPATATLAAGATIAFSAAVTGVSNTAVTWAVLESSGCGATDQGGVYTAPPAAAICHVVAASAAVPTRSATATVTVTAPPPAVVVAVSPTVATLSACDSLTFGATVTGTSNTGVVWSVPEGAAGGSIAASGVYTAPATTGTYHVVATSSAAPASSASVPVTVSAERVLSVSVAPQTIPVPEGGSVQFTASVTTTCGTYASVQAIQPPASAAR